MARYYYYKTIRVGGQNNNIFNIHKGLDIIRATNYKLEGLIMPLRLVRVQGSIKKVEVLAERGLPAIAPYYHLVSACI